MIKKLLIFGLFSLVLTHTAQAQLFGKKKNKNKKEATTEKPKKDKNGIKKYGDVITEDAVIDDGLFKVHQMMQVLTNSGSN